jgi:hypothetical protein
MPARFTQITDKSQLAPDHHALADHIVQARGGLRGPYSILLYDPAITDKVDALAGALFERLKERHGVRWLADLTVAPGHFGLISGINNAFEVPPNPEGDQLPV